MLKVGVMWWVIVFLLSSGRTKSWKTVPTLNPGHNQNKWEQKDSLNLMSDTHKGKNVELTSFWGLLALICGVTVSISRFIKFLFFRSSLLPNMYNCLDFQYLIPFMLVCPKYHNLSLSKFIRHMYLDNVNNYCLAREYPFTAKMLKNTFWNTCSYF